jgi:ATP-dependent Clp protease adaptor protein ClpS
MDDDPLTPKGDFPSGGDSGGGDAGMATVVSTKTKPKAKPKNERKGKGVPQWNVILWDSDQHTYEYVMVMLKELFGHADETCFLLAQRVDSQGKAVVLTTTHEHAELKRDQILAYGKDGNMKDCKGSMHCTIESIET